MEQHIKKIWANMVCALIPDQKKRKAIRKLLLLPGSGPVYSKYAQEKVPAKPFSPPLGNDLYSLFLENNAGDIHKFHHYFPIYYKHFSRYRDTPVIVLEIGVSKGGSLKMWKNFFGKQAVIFGVDIDETCKRFENAQENIHVVIGDQGDARFLRTLMAELPPVDILIDDGGHTTAQQITTFLECYDKIADDGVYLCEDLHTNYWPSFINTPETFIEFAKRHVDCLNAWYFDVLALFPENIPVFTSITHSVTFYDSIIVFEKSQTTTPCHEFR